MRTVTIKRERLATRCELCHQVDRFDPKNNFCSRCQGIDDNELNINQQRYGKYFSRAISDHVLNSKIARQFKNEGSPKAKTLLSKIVGDEGTTIHSTLLMVGCLLMFIYERSLFLTSIILLLIVVSFMFGCVVTYLYQKKTTKKTNMCF